jgi:hypothetical protein
MVTALLHRHAPSGREQDCMGRQSAASEAGLTEELIEKPRGNWRAILTTPTGEVVFDRDGYLKREGAREGSRRWLRLHYAQGYDPIYTAVPEDESEEVTPKRSEAETERARQAGNLRRKADRSEGRAVSLREQANELEADAKRYRSAADVLES